MRTFVSDRDPATASAPSTAYARYVLALLSTVAVLNVIDRQVLSVLIEPIKAELGVFCAPIYEPKSKPGSSGSPGTSPAPGVSCTHDEY